MKKTIEIESSVYYEVQDLFMHIGVRNTLDNLLNDFSLWHKDDYIYQKKQAKAFLKMLQYTISESQLGSSQIQQEQEIYEELFENWKKFYKNKTDWTGGV